MKIINNDKVIQSIDRIIVDRIPNKLHMTSFAFQKARTIMRLVEEMFKGSPEWYGYSLAKRDNPKLVLDIGLANNIRNDIDYTKIGSMELEEFKNNINKNMLINGWLHSHGKLGLNRFSSTDDANDLTVFDYNSPITGITTELIETIVNNKSVVTNIEDLLKNKDNTLIILADKSIIPKKIYRRIIEAFSYSMVMGDSNWYQASITSGRNDVLLNKYEKPDRKIVNLELEIIPREISNYLIKKIHSDIIKNIHPKTKNRMEKMKSTDYYRIKNKVMRDYYEQLNRG